MDEGTRVAVGGFAEAVAAAVDSVGEAVKVLAAELERVELRVAELAGRVSEHDGALGRLEHLPDELGELRDAIQELAK